MKEKEYEVVTHIFGLEKDWVIKDDVSRIADSINAETNEIIGMKGGEIQTLIQQGWRLKSVSHAFQGNWVLVSILIERDSK